MCQAIDKGRIKRTLYKYRTTEQLDMILKNMQFYFATYKEFNDPFEFSIKMSGLDEEGAKNYVDELCSKQEPWLRSIVEKCGERNSYVDILKEAISRQTAQMGIFCCSAVNDNILMWSHYADGHKGCCIEFDVTEDMPFFCFPKPIVYSSKYIECELIKDGALNIKDVIPSFFHKVPDWSYEQEYRIIKHDFNGFLKINSKAIKSIIVGCRMPENDINDIKEKLGYSRLLQHVQLKRCVIDENEYKLNIIDVPFREHCCC